MRIVEEVKAVLAESGLLKTNATIVVAVSGGVDSMALLHVMHHVLASTELTLVAAHVNHGFRVEESAAEAKLVQDYCKKQGIRLEIAELNMPEYLQHNKENSQAASRARRYQFFHEVAAKYKASAIALAHHADDQAETILMHVLRGTGLNGLKGIVRMRNEKNVELIRPLLRMRKNELLAYCQQQAVPFLEDSSNKSRHYQRNALRMDIIPQLERFNPQLVTSLCRLAEIAGEDEAWLQEQCEQRFNKIVSRDGNSYIIRCKQLNAEPIALQRRLIKLILSYLSQDEDVVSFEGVERIRTVARLDTKSVGRMDIGAGLICVREYEQLRFVHIKDYENAGSVITPLLLYQEQLPCELQYGDWLIRACLVDKNEQPQLRSKYEAVFDIDALTMPLVIRKRINGDRMQVLGLKGSKKVQDMFVDAKIAAAKRDHYPIIADGSGEILWLPGIRRSLFGLVNENSKWLLHLKCDRYWSSESDELE